MNSKDDICEFKQCFRVKMGGKGVGCKYCSFCIFPTLLIILDGDEMIMMLVTTDDNEDSWWPSVLRLRFQLSLGVFKSIEVEVSVVPTYLSTCSRSRVILP